MPSSTEITSSRLACIAALPHVRTIIGDRTPEYLEGDPRLRRRRGIQRHLPSSVCSQITEPLG